MPSVSNGGTSLVAIVNGVMVLIWLTLAWRIGRGYRDLSITGRPPASSVARHDDLVTPLSPRPTEAR